MAENGLTLVPAGAAWGRIPTLIPWVDVRGFSADRQVELPDGTRLQVLTIVTRNGGAVGSGPRRATGAGRAVIYELAIAAPDLSAVFRGVAAYSEIWARAAQVGPLRAAGATGRRTAAALAALIAGSLVGSWVGRAVTPAGRVLATCWALVAQVSGLADRAARSAHGHAPGSRPRHGMGTRRRLAAIAGAVFILGFLAGNATGSVPQAASAGAHARFARAATHRSIGNAVFAAQQSPSAPPLAPAVAPPAPAPPVLAAAPPLQSHEIFGYAPYWTLPQAGAFDVQDLTTLAYFSVGVNGNGTLDESGPGWNGYESQDLADLITRAHAAGDRVVLTVSCFSQSALNSLTADPTVTGARLSSALVTAISAKNLDGVNFDFEGKGSADRNGLTALITQVSASLHAADPHWQVTMATYASSASDPHGFYDIPALAPAVDAFFVMAYDMNDPSSPSPTAPLVGSGFNDTKTLQAYTAVVPPQKVILGVPYYGYDWPTANGTLGAPATGAETAVSYSQIASSGEPTYWDPATETAWTSYQVNGQWHETYFDDPTSLALKARLAGAYGIRGMGIWALGMDGNDPAMLAALLGSAPPVKDYTTGPASTAPSTPVTGGSGVGGGGSGSGSGGGSGTAPAATAPGAGAVGGGVPSGTVPTGTVPAGGSGSSGSGGLPGAGYVTTAQWNGARVQLTPVAMPSLTGGVEEEYLGALTGVQTDDPALGCLTSGSLIDVYSVAGKPGVDIAVGFQPASCITAAWSFPADIGSTGTRSTTTTTTTVSPSTTTTTVPSTTTTTVPSSTTTTTVPKSSSTSKSAGSGV